MNSTIDRIRPRAGTWAAAALLAFALLPAHADDSTTDKVKDSADKTGTAVERGVTKAAEAVETTAKRTGEGISIGVKKGTEAVKQVAAKASEAVVRGTEKAKGVFNSPMPPATPAAEKPATEPK